MKSLFCMFCTLAIASSVSAQETGNAMLKYGLNFLKTPYVAHTLEVNEEEKLVVNFDEVDCTTFVEYVLALSLSPVKNGAIDKTDYARVLQRLYFPPALHCRLDKQRCQTWFYGRCNRSQQSRLNSAVPQLHVLTSQIVQAVGVFSRECQQNREYRKSPFRTDIPLHPQSQTSRRRF